jgi:hypothetical protein
MNEQTENRLRHEDANRSPAQPAPGPWWRRAHRDWRVWVGVVVMLAAMTIYVLTGDLYYRISVRPSPPAVPVAVPR